MAEEALLTMRGICKYFPGVRALENVDFTLHSGKVHALVGENGAGKSTLIKVLTGVHAKDGGKIAMEGRPISPSSPLEAMKCGISTVYQEVNMCPNLSVAENIFIGREPKKAGGIDWKTINRRAAELLTTLNLNIDVTKTLGSYSVAVQQMIAIARAVDVDAKVLILTARSSVPDRVAGLDCGADDYLAKPFVFEELEARVRCLLRRQFVQTDVRLSCGELEFDTLSRNVRAKGQPLSLTKKETALLEYLMLHTGCLVSQEELIEHVWDDSVDPFSSSVRVHISSLRRKLRAVLAYDPIQNRSGEGYILSGEGMRP